MIAVGVDTHKEQHLAVALDGLGQVLAEIVITTTLAGYSQFVCWLKELGENVLVGIEGAGSYGAGLCEYLQAEEIEVFEVERPQRRERRTGKSDRLDALLAACARRWRSSAMTSSWMPFAQPTRRRTQSSSTA
jgi:transposase